MRYRNPLVVAASKTAWATSLRTASFFEFRNGAKSITGIGAAAGGDDDDDDDDDDVK